MFMQIWEKSFKIVQDRALPFFVFKVLESQINNIMYQTIYYRMKLNLKNKTNKTKTGLSQLHQQDSAA